MTGVTAPFHTVGRVIVTCHLQIETGVHPRDPDVIKANHAPCVYPGKDFDAVTSPFGNLGSWYAGVQPPHHAPRAGDRTVVSSVVLPAVQG